METSKGQTSKLISYFLYLYIIAQVFELFFNREFLVSVLPFGLAGISPTKIEPYLQGLYLIGGTAYTLILLLEPLILILAIIYIKDKLSRALLLSVLYLAVLADTVHIIYGVNNTSFLLPTVYSLVFVSMIIITSIYLSTRARKTFMIFVLIPDILAYMFLMFNWASQFGGWTLMSLLSGYSGDLIAYSVLFVGSGIVVYSVMKRMYQLKVLLPFAIVGISVALVSGLNLIPGWGIALGTIFPYILGFLGVSDWMPPVFFAIAMTAIGCIVSMYKYDRPLSLAILSLIVSSLIFDSVPIITYLLEPLISFTFLYLVGEKNKSNIETKIT